MRQNRYQSPSEPLPGWSDPVDLEKKNAARDGGKQDLATDLAVCIYMQVPGWCNGYICAGHLLDI
jgi:hypothetical protein